MIREEEGREKSTEDQREDRERNLPRKGHQLPLSRGFRLMGRRAPTHIKESPEPCFSSTALQEGKSEET